MQRSSCYLRGAFAKVRFLMLVTLISVSLKYIFRLATETVLEVREKAENLMTKLITPPDETNKFVKYLYFLDNCHEKIVTIEKVLGYALRAFQIMKEYRIMVNDDAKESYLDMEEFLKELKSILEAKVEAKQEIIDQLAESLQNDIKLIFSEVAEVGEEILKPWLIDVRIFLPSILPLLYQLLILGNFQQFTSS